MTWTWMWMKSPCVLCGITSGMGKLMGLWCMKALHVFVAAMQGSSISMRRLLENHHTMPIS